MRHRVGPGQAHAQGQHFVNEQLGLEMGLVAIRRDKPSGDQFCMPGDLFHKDPVAKVAIGIEAGTMAHHRSIDSQAGHLGFQVPHIRQTTMGSYRWWAEEGIAGKELRTGWHIASHRCISSGMAQYTLPIALATSSTSESVMRGPRATQSNDWRMLSVLGQSSGA